MNQYVQHISRQGPKYRLQEDECERLWCYRVNHDGLVFYLPKSDYILCSPPEEWVNVTAQIDATPRHGWHYDHDIDSAIFVYTGYRLRKVQLRRQISDYPDLQWAFIVERQVR